MRVLVLGAGAVGGYFGGRLAAAGIATEFLVRPHRADLLRERGLVIHSPLGDLRVAVTVRTAVDSAADVILLACKAYDLEPAMTLLAPAVGSSTLILPLLNGIRHLAALDAHFGREHVLGALCHIGATLDAQGEIRHLNKLHRFTFGPRAASQSEPAKALLALLKRGGFEVIMSDQIAQELWEKFTFLTAYAGLTTLMRAPIGAIVTAADGKAIARELIEECAATAAAADHAPRPDARQQMLASLTEDGSTGTASMLRDMQRSAPTEHEHIVGDMLARARAAGISTPLLRTCLANLQAYDAVRTASTRSS